MKVFAKTDHVSKEDWLKLRTQGIGGSDVSVIVGINQYKSIFQLWMEKTGLMIPEVEDNEYIHFGNVLEPIVRQEFMRRTGIKVRQKKSIIQHPNYSFMFANVDGVIYEEDGISIFEAKTASAFKAKEWDNHVPKEYQLQIQHYMAVTGAKRTYIAALIGGNQFVYHIVERDEELINLIIRMEKQFWDNHVLNNIPPEIDGSSATTEYLNNKYRTTVKNVIELPRETLDLLYEYDDLTEQIKGLNTKKDVITNKLKDYLKENEEGYIEDRIIKWSAVTKNKVDQKHLKEEMEDIYNKYVTQTCYRRFMVA